MRSLRALSRDVGASVRFLTVIPWPAAPSSDAGAVARAAWAFPCVGLLVGVCSAAVGLAAQCLFGQPFQAIAAVAAATVITGGLHLDGVGDSADALFSWRSRERKLEILHDSRIGTMGVLALFLDLATKLVALQALAPAWWKAALLAPLWGRWAALYGMVAFPAARLDGLGAELRRHPLARNLAVASVLVLPIGAVLLWPVGALLVLLVLPLTHCVGHAMARSLGGLTGDTYGALSEIAELTVCIALVALRRHTSLA